MKNITKNYDVVVVGGGVAGMCAAIAAARHGAQTALVQNRPVLGGNASGEIRMHICGADHHNGRKNARETGIVEEIQLKNKARNPEYSYPIFDAVMWECANFEPNLDLYLNLHIDKVETDGSKIISASGTQQTSERYYTFTAKTFIDATGDGTLCALCGAQYMYGREDKSEFNEPDGQPKADNCTMGNSVMFQAKDLGHPVKYTKPDWAYTYTEEDLRFREHGCITSGYWWVELGGNAEHTIDDAEEIRDELYKTVYGLWDHIKNGGDHGAENFELEWVCMLPGKRESRRLLGDYVLTENDLTENRHFNDAVGYGGWPIDCHVIDGFKTGSEKAATKYIHLADVYEIPYRCIVSNNIDNLFLSGRAISATHLAFASTRVIATCAVLGQAAGTAAAMALQIGTTPKGMYEHIDQLQQELLKDDCYIPNVKNHDENDLARTAKITASSYLNGYEPEKIINGIARDVHDDVNCWQSDGLAENGEYIEICLEKAAEIREIRLTFDSDLSKQITISINDWVKQNEIKTMPLSLVKDYDIELYLSGECIKKIEKNDNILRHNVISLEKSVKCDTIKVNIKSTYGAKCVRVFEARIY